MKKILTVLAFLTGFIMAQAVTVYAPKAPPTIPLAKAAQEDKSIEIVLYNDVTTEVLPKILKNVEALYIIPTNVSAKLYNKGMDTGVIAVTSMGLLHIITTDDNIKSVEDMDGKQVYIGEQGSSPDVIARHIFNEKKIKPEIVYTSSPEVAKFLIAGKAKTVVLPEPLASMAVANAKGARRIADLKKEWAALEKTKGIPQVGITGTSKYIDENRKAIDKLAELYEKAVEWAKANPAEAAQLGKSVLSLEIPPKIIENSIPLMNLIYMSGREAKADLTVYFEKLNEYDKTAIGGKIPDDKFFKE